MHNVYTYYETTHTHNESDQVMMIDHWKRSWAKRGWNPVVLGEQHARLNPLFDMFDKKVSALPTVNSAKYETACYRRWLAVATMGGGFMSDYDVVNYSFTARKPEGDLVIYESNPYSLNITPSVVGGSAYGFLRACLAFAASNPDDIVSTENGQPHTSDMIALQKMWHTGIYTPSPTVELYGMPDWDKAPMVHYASGATAGTDRTMCMKSARPL